MLTILHWSSITTALREEKFQVLRSALGKYKIPLTKGLGAFQICSMIVMIKLIELKSYIAVFFFFVLAPIPTFSSWTTLVGKQFLKIGHIRKDAPDLDRVDRKFSPQ